MSLTLKHQTKTQFLTRLRERHISTSGESSTKISSRLIDWLNAGDITDLEARTAFDMTTQEWAIEKSKMAAIHTSYITVIPAKVGVK